MTIGLEQRLHAPGVVHDIGALLRRHAAIVLGYF
jgi:hypothetical protein